MSSEGKYRNKEYERLVRRVDPARTEEMDVSQTTTNDWSLVPESVLEPDGRRQVAYIVAEVEGSDAVDVRIVKRIHDDGEGISPWVPDPGPAAEKIALPSGDATELRPAATSADEYAIQVRSNTEDWHGEVEVFGVARAQE